MRAILLWKETRPQFLILSVALGFLGTCLAWFHGSFHLGHALLAGFGLVLAHVSVNVLNDYFDFRSGVDLATRRTPFSGGSGLLPAGALTPGQVKWLGVGALLLAVPIGVYFSVVSGWQLVPLLLVAALCVVLYTPVILKFYWPEWSPGVGLGILPVLGMYFVQTGHYTLTALAAAVPSGILVHNLLLLNEFPDVDADRERGRRKTMPVVLGKPRARVFYAAMTAAVYLWVTGLVVAGAMPWPCLLALLTLPLAAQAIRLSRHFDDPAKFTPALALNVLVVIVTQVLLGAGFLVGGALSAS